MDVYAPMKAAWQVLTKWKQSDGMFYITLAKNHFPQMLFSLLKEMQNKAEYAIWLQNNCDLPT